MTDGDAYVDPATYEHSVGPRYAAPFASLLLSALELGRSSSVLDLYGRTGAVSIPLLQRAPGAQLAAIDPDPGFAMTLRERAGTEARLVVAAASVNALPFDDNAFTHVLGNLVDRASNNRAALLSEARRVLTARGQLVLTMPLRGSFFEVLDMFREVALKYDLPGVAERVERYADSLPTVEQWRGEIERAGFSHVEVAQAPVTVEYHSAAALFTDPVSLAAALPEWQWCAAGGPDGLGTLAKVEETVETYFRGHAFEMTVNAGCASARRGA